MTWILNQESGFSQDSLRILFFFCCCCCDVFCFCFDDDLRGGGRGGEGEDSLWGFSCRDSARDSFWGFI